MRKTVPNDIQDMNRSQLIAELHTLQPNAGWNTAATGTRTLRLCLVDERANKLVTVQAASPEPAGEPIPAPPERDAAIKLLQLSAFPHESLVDVIARVTRNHGAMCPCNNCSAARAV